MTPENEGRNSSEIHIPTKETEAEINEVQHPTQPIAAQPLPSQVNVEDISGANQQAPLVDSGDASGMVTAQPITEPEQNDELAQSTSDQIEITEAHLNAVIEKYESKRRELEIFVDGVRSLLMEHPALYRNGKCIVHSSKFRLKDPDHLKQKVRRKAAIGKLIDESNLFNTVTDLGGVRILHLFQDDFRYVDGLIKQKVFRRRLVLIRKAGGKYMGPGSKVVFL